MKSSVFAATVAMAAFGMPRSDALLAGLRRNNEAANALEPELECKIYSSTPLYDGLYAPAAIMQSQDKVARSVINVPDAFDVKQVEVGANITYTRLGALRIRLEAQPGPDAGEEDVRGTNLLFRKGKAKTQMVDTFFSDSSTEAFPNTPEGTPLPDDAEPFTGTWQPERILGQLAAGPGKQAGRGGSQGLWTLIIEDMAEEPETRHGRIGSWEVKLCYEPSEEVPPTLQEAPAGSGSTSTVPSEVTRPLLEQLDSILQDDPELAEELDQELQEEQESQAGAFGTTLVNDATTAVKLPFSRMREAIADFRSSHGLKSMPMQAKLALWEFLVVKKFVWLVYLYKTGKLATIPPLKDFDFKKDLPGLYDYLDDLTSDFKGLTFRLFGEAEAPSPEEAMDLDEVLFR